MTDRYRADHSPLGFGACAGAYEPGEDWWYCYIDELGFLFVARPSFAYP